MMFGFTGRESAASAGRRRANRRGSLLFDRLEPRQMMAGNTLSGTVLSGNGVAGKRLAHVQVSLYEAADCGCGSVTPALLGTATTRANGTFRISVPKATTTSLFYVTANLGGDVSLTSVLGTKLPKTGITVNELHHGRDGVRAGPVLSDRRADRRRWLWSRHRGRHVQQPRVEPYRQGVVGAAVVAEQVRDEFSADAAVAGQPHGGDGAEPGATTGRPPVAVLRRCDRERYGSGQCLRGLCEHRQEPRPERGRHLRHDPLFGDILQRALPVARRLHADGRRQQFGQPEKHDRRARPTRVRRQRHCLGDQQHHREHAQFLEVHHGAPAQRRSCGQWAQIAALRRRHPRGRLWHHDRPHERKHLVHELRLGKGARQQARPGSVRQRHRFGVGVQPDRRAAVRRRKGCSGSIRRPASFPP